MSWADAAIVWDMFLREVKRQNRNGTQVSYLQLVHNHWDAAARTSRTKILNSFGRTDRVDTAATERLIVSLARLLNPAAALRATAGSGLSFISSRPLGGTDVLDGLWRRLGIDTVMTKLLATRRGSAPFERVLFALVANRALAPSSTLAAADWICNDVHIDGLAEVSDDVCYRAMDWLHDVREQLEKEVFHQVANLLNLEVDLLFFDTTSTYFELDDADEPAARNARGHPLPDTDTDTDTTVEAGDAGGKAGDGVGFRTWGKSKDSRDDLPQIVIGMAVTREGDPGAGVVLAGQHRGLDPDPPGARRHAGLDAVADRVGRRPRILLGGQPPLPAPRGSPLHHRGEAALRLPRDQDRAVPPRPLHHDRGEHAGQGGQGLRHRTVRDLPQPRSRAARRRCPRPARGPVGRADQDSDGLSAHKRGELAGRISVKPGLHRFLRTTPSGKLRIDTAKVKTETNLDGKYLLRSSDPTLSAADIAVGHKQLLEVERGWRDMKSVIDLRPVHHRLEDRIRAHVVLCWLALLLIRVAEITTGHTWPTIRCELHRLHAVTFTGPSGTFRQTTNPTKPQVDLYARLDLPLPKKIIEIATSSS